MNILDRYGFALLLNNYQRTLLSEGPLERIQARRALQQAYDDALEKIARLEKLTKGQPTVDVLTPSYAPLQELYEFLERKGNLLNKEGQVVAYRSIPPASHLEGKPLIQGHILIGGTMLLHTHTDTHEAVYMYYPSSKTWDHRIVRRNGV